MGTSYQGHRKALKFIGGKSNIYYFNVKLVGKKWQCIDMEGNDSNLQFNLWNMSGMYYFYRPERWLRFKPLFSTQLSI